mmetsp:Transcript_44/g.101  ORF Transcript_44/g.101 Transcript_44/m.101 type:complete len:614 (-) Transcript_44:62-1903(-)
MKLSKVIFCEAQLTRDSCSKGVHNRFLGYDAPRWNDANGLLLADGGHQYDVRLLAENRVGIPDDSDGADALVHNPELLHQSSELRSVPAVGDEDDDVLVADVPQVSVSPFARVDEVGGNPDRAQRGGHPPSDVPRLPNPRDKHPSPGLWGLDQHVAGAVELGLEAGMGLILRGEARGAMRVGFERGQRWEGGAAGPSGGRGGGGRRGGGGLGGPGRQEPVRHVRGELGDSPRRVCHVREGAENLDTRCAGRGRGLPEFFELRYSCWEPPSKSIDPSDQASEESIPSPRGVDLVHPRMASDGRSNHSIAAFAASIIDPFDCKPAAPLPVRHCDHPGCKRAKESGCDILEVLSKDAFDVDLGLNRVARLPIRRGECEELRGGVQSWFEDVTAPDACEYLLKAAEARIPSGNRGRDVDVQHAQGLRPPRDVEQADDPAEGDLGDLGGGDLRALHGPGKVGRQRLGVDVPRRGRRHHDRALALGVKENVTGRGRVLVAVLDELGRDAKLRHLAANHLAIVIVPLQRQQGRRRSHHPRPREVVERDPAHHCPLRHLSRVSEVHLGPSYWHRANLEEDVHHIRPAPDDGGAAPEEAPPHARLRGCVRCWGAKRAPGCTL